MVNSPWSLMGLYMFHHFYRKSLGNIVPNSRGRPQIYQSNGSVMGDGEAVDGNPSVKFPGLAGCFFEQLGYLSSRNFQLWSCGSVLKNDWGKACGKHKKSPKSTKHVAFFVARGILNFHKDGNMLFHDFLWRLKFLCRSDDLKVSNLL